MILVTGSSGLVGSHVLFRLVNEGYRGKALIRSKDRIQSVKRIFQFYTNISDELLRQIEWVEGDVLDIGSLEEAFDGVDKVYHCAAVVSFKKADKSKILTTNVKGTLNIVNLCLAKRIIKLAYVSSVAVLGQNPEQKTITEDDLFNEIPKNTTYAMSKFLAEREIWRGIAEGMNAVIVNPSTIIGPGDWQKGSSQLFTEIYHGLKYYTEGVTGYVDVRDVADTLILLMKSEIINERFILNSENLCFKDLFDMMADALGKPRPMVRINKFTAEIAWRLFTLKSLVTGKPSAITAETARSAFVSYYYSNQKFKETFPNYSFIPIRNSIADTAKIFITEHSLS